MKILVTGCSWIQAMHKQQILRGNDFTFKSFGGQGLWRIESYLKDIQKDTFDFIFVQLPTPVRNEINSLSTTEKFNEFVDDIKKLGEKLAANKWLTEYKQKIIDINKIHKNIVFFLYNVGGYPFRHPYDYGMDIDNKMIEFFKKAKLSYIDLSFEGIAGYGKNEDKCDDLEFWEYYHANNPKNQSDKDFKKYWSIISPKNWISIDPHPNEKADKIALEVMLDYLKNKGQTNVKKDN